jgi:hypothetical protein
MEKQLVAKMVRRKGSSFVLEGHLLVHERRAQHQGELDPLDLEEAVLGAQLLKDKVRQLSLLCAYISISMKP